jgi:Vault protein inter-alpha-trypsin domain/Uncharacterized protein conserved in bacteria (DUF2135)
MRQSVFSRPLLFALGVSMACTFVPPAAAQTRSRPVALGQETLRPALDLKAHDTRTDRAAVSAKSLTIATLDVSIKIVGGLAETTLTAQFTNPNDSVLEGDFTLDLPREAWVVGFALDVNGTLVDGVLQPKAKAAEAYEENLRRGVDPGLGEINDANQFRTRIFPINPRSGRTVKITYVSTLDASGAYSLPLTTAAAVGRVTVNVTNEGNARPRIKLPNGLRAANPQGNLPSNAASPGFYDGYGQTIGNFEGQNAQLRGNLELSNLGPEDGVKVISSRNGDQYFTFVAPPAPVTAAKPKIIRLYWDTSRSRREDGLAKEISLLERYVAQVGPDQLDVVFFSDEAPRTTSLNRSSMGTMARLLRDVRYQGASRFGELERAGQGEADLCLLFSDGQLTVDAFNVRTWPCRVVTVSTSANARRDILEGIASANRGIFIDLKASDISSAMTQLQTRGPDLRALQTDSGAAVDYIVTPMANGSFRITGPKPDANDLAVKTYGTERRLSLQSATTTSHSGPAALWGVNQIKRLSATDNPNTDELLAAVRRYGVATTDYSYIVLETVEDYARNNIAPAPGIGKDFLAQYQAHRAQIEAGERLAKEQRFAAVMAQWNEQKTWWKTRFAAQAQPKAQSNANGGPEPTSGRVDSEQRREGAPPPPPPAPPPPPPQPTSAVRASPGLISPRPRQASAPSEVSRDAQSITVTGARAVSPGGTPDQAQVQAPPRSTISVTAAAWNPDRPYLAALRQVKSGEATPFEAVYKDQEVRYGNTPAFYFDMAEWAFRNGLTGRAAAIARNALELSSTSIDTKIILASRLVRYGDFERAIWLNERILQATPSKPQALRNLALSVIDAADAGRTAATMQSPAAIAAYERALGLLMKIVLTPNNGDYDGIELIALMEANHVAQKLKALGVSEARLATLIDPRLVALLAVDIRVTLEWNTDKTDMDLWVDEPTGERAVFNNPRTAIGGRLSNDMTRGYGPEEYLLNVAPNGQYKVQSNAYAGDRLDPNGPTSLTVKLYRDWGRPTQKVESFVVELNRGQQQSIEVGRFVKGP